MAAATRPPAVPPTPIRHRAVVDVPTSVVGDVGAERHLYDPVHSSSNKFTINISGVANGTYVDPTSLSTERYQHRGHPIRLSGHRKLGQFSPGRDKSSLSPKHEREGGEANPQPITKAACCAHGRRKFFVPADFTQVPLAIEAVRRIDEIFAVEINDALPNQRHAVRQQRIKPLVAALEGWKRTERTRLSRHFDTAKAIDYMLKRWPAFTRFLDDGPICLTNNAAEWALRGIAIRRRA